MSHLLPLTAITCCLTPVVKVKDIRVTSAGVRVIVYPWQQGLGLPRPDGRRRVRQWYL